MARKRHKPEEIVAKLRQVEVLTSQGQSLADAIRSIGVTEVTYYRWRQEFGGLKSDQVKRLKDKRVARHHPRRVRSERVELPPLEDEEEGESESQTAQIVKTKELRTVSQKVGSAKRRV